MSTKMAVRLTTLCLFALLFSAACLCWPLPEVLRVNVNLAFVTVFLLLAVILFCLVLISALWVLAEILRLISWFLMRPLSMTDTSRKA